LQERQVYKEEGWQLMQAGAPSHFIQLSPFGIYPTMHLVHWFGFSHSVHKLEAQLNTHFPLF